MRSNTKDTQLSFSSPLSFHADDNIWFVKDNDNSYRMNRREIAVPLSEMLHETSTTKGFSCASKLSPRFTEELGHFDYLPLNIAVQQQIGRFHLKSVNHRSRYNVSVDVAKDEPRDIFHPTNPNVTVLGDWVDSLPIYNFSLGNKAKHQQQKQKVWDANKQQAVDFIPTTTTPQYVNEFMPVCFGGIFMTKWDRLRYAPVGNWSHIVQSLARGDNLEEGHFMERMWAALLSEPISQSTQRLLLQSNNSNNYKVCKLGSSCKGMVFWPQQQIADWQTFDQNIDFVLVEKQDLTATKWDTPLLQTTW
jgi:hypothetical protein